MTARQQWMAVLAVVAVLAGGLWAATRFLGDELFPVSVGSPAPSFAARTLDARPVTKTLADYEGQVVLLNVWATWCEPCRAEMPSIQALHESYGSEKFRVVAVSVDAAGDEQKIRDFGRDYGLSFELLHDPSGEIQRRFQTTGVPESFVIGPDGIIRKKVIGAADWHSPANRALIERLAGGRGAADPAPPRALVHADAPA
ncbi:MAG: Cytochrome c-type biogenesis protein CcmG/DsbE, thiol:disulfide oxidoreductase, partial [uncultured Gemmatimonadaceae bacterium]